MKKMFLGFIALLGLVIPTTSFAATSSFGGLLTAPVIVAPKLMSCSLEGTIKRTNNITNEVTYKIKYGSNYTKINAHYTVAATVDRPDANLTLYQGGGAVSFVSGNGYLALQGNGESKFTYPIKDNPGVTVVATVDGIKCASKYFKTIQPAVISDTRTGVNTTINTSILASTSTLNGNVPAEEPVVPPSGVILPPVQMHTCKMLVEAAPADNTKILIGGAISFSDMKMGQYSYTVRGYRSDTPHTLTKYTGTYNAKVDTKSGMILGEGGKSFLFTYDSKSSTDSYTITATVGNIDCSAVVFPSRLARINQNDNAHLQASTSSVAGGGQNSQGSINNSAPESVSSTEQNGVVAVGLSEEERQEGSTLNLLQKTGDENAKIALEQNTETSSVPTTNWTSRDYAVAGLLGAILVSIIGYIVMKYRGML